MPAIKLQYLKFAQIIFLAIYFVLGVCLAHQVGITWDEDAEHTTLLTNVAAIDGLYHSDITNFNKLEKYADRFNGVGFQILAYPITRIVAPLLTHYTNLNSGID